MHYKIMSILAVLILITTVYVAHAGVDMHDGMWEITAKVEMPGMPMEMPGATFRQCLTSDHSIPDNKAQNPGCEVMKSKVEGNTVQWELQCTREGRTMKSRGEISYSGDTFKGIIKSDMDSMQMTQQMNGRRIGDCK